MQVLIFCALGLKCLFTPQKYGFLGFDPQLGSSMNVTQKAHPCAETSIDRQNRSTCAGSARADE